MNIYKKTPSRPARTLAPEAYYIRHGHVALKNRTYFMRTAHAMQKIPRDRTKILQIATIVGWSLHLNSSMHQNRLMRLTGSHLVAARANFSY